MQQPEVSNFDSSAIEADEIVPDSESNSMEKGRTMRAKGLKLPSISVESMQIVALIAIITILAISMQINNDRFLSAANLKVMTVNFIPEAIMALGMTKHKKAASTIPEKVILLGMIKCLISMNMMEMNAPIRKY